MSSFQTPAYPSWDNLPPAYSSQIPTNPLGSTYPIGATPYPQMPGYQPTQGFPSAQAPYPPGSPFPVMPEATYPGPGAPALESSYIENILRLNLGKVATIYMNFENSQWGSKVFKGILRAAGKDHIIIVDPDTNIHYLLLTIYLDYITFDVPIVYTYPFAGGQGPSGTMPTGPAQTVPPIFTPTPIPTPGPGSATGSATGSSIPQGSPYTQFRKKENKE